MLLLGDLASKKTSRGFHFFGVTQECVVDSAVVVYGDDDVYSLDARLAPNLLVDLDLFLHQSEYHCYLWTVRQPSSCLVSCC